MVLPLWSAHRRKSLIVKLFKNVQVFLSWLNIHDPDDGFILARINEESLEEFGSPIYYSAFLGLKDVLKTLSEAGRRTSTAKTFLGNTNGWYSNALQAASFKGHEEVIDILLEEGADPNARGGEFGFALQAAAFAGHDRVVRMLLENGADVYAQGGAFGSALSAASSQGHEKIVQILLEKLKKSDSHHDKCAALLQASSKGFDKVVELLLRMAPISILGEKKIQ
jgi:ankyrin repeat protein